MENYKEYVTTSLQGYTKQSGLNRGRSPRYVGTNRLPVRQYLALSEEYVTISLEGSI